MPPDDADAAVLRSIFQTKEMRKNSQQTLPKGSF